MTLAERVSSLALAVRDKLNLMTPRLIPAGGASGQVLRKTAVADYSVGWVDPGYPSTLTKKASNQSFTATTLADITSLTAALAANSTYRVKGKVLFQSAGLLIGANIGFAGPAGSTGYLTILVPVSGVALSNASWGSFAASSGNVSTTSVVAVNTTLVADVEGIIVTGATSGSITLRGAASGVAAAITILAGSVLFVEKVG